MNTEKKVALTFPPSTKVNKQRSLHSNNQITPRIIQGYSVNTQGIFKANTSELKFFRKPRPEQFPLNVNTCEKPCDHADYLDNMLYFIRHHKELMLLRRPGVPTKLKANIITQHKVLHTILCTHYRNTNWRILGTKYQDTVYLCLGRTDSLDKDEVLEILHTCEGMERGLKSYLYTDAPQDECRFSNNIGEFHGVFECDIAGLCVVYNSVMGAANPIILHTDRNDHFERKNMFTECKVFIPGSLEQTEDKPMLWQALIWWSDCILKDVWYLHIAPAAETGDVRDIQNFAVEALSIDQLECRRCIFCLEHTLTIIYNLIQLDNADTVYQFDYEAKKGEILYNVIPERNENTFISDWYRTMLNQEIGNQTKT